MLPTDSDPRQSLCNFPAREQLKSKTKQGQELLTSFTIHAVHGAIQRLPLGYPQYPLSYPQAIQGHPENYPESYPLLSSFTFSLSYLGSSSAIMPKALKPVTVGHGAG